jgi:hypothetical protein
MLVRGLQAQHPDDDALFTTGISFFDALHAALQAPKRH